MPTRPSKRKLAELEQTNQAAHRIFAQTTGEKNPAAVALGKLGASKGGKARAASLSASARSAIAKKAATARWGKK
ncbi:MAG: hypothetical protein ABSA97_03145 [Verrucomicrobiia bacterium]